MNGNFQSYTNDVRINQWSYMVHKAIITSGALEEDNVAEIIITLFVGLLLGFLLGAYWND